MQQLAQQEQETEQSGYHSWQPIEDLFIVAADQDGLSCQDQAAMLGVSVNRLYQHRHHISRQGFMDDDHDLRPVLCHGCPELHRYFGADGDWCRRHKFKVYLDDLICRQRLNELQDGDA